MNNTDLVLKLFNPDKDGYSRWVGKDECVGEYESLYPKNGNHWYRNVRLKKFIFEKKEENKKIFWRFNGLKNESGSRNIRPDIWNNIREQPCVITGLRLRNGHKIEVDHKDGRYPEDTLNLHTQKIIDFQPLLESLNKQKRSDCRKCKETNIRYDATEKGFKFPVIEGTLNYEGTCKGCYWFDVLEFISNLGLSEH
jgi:hypothetical protein